MTKSQLQSGMLVVTRKGDEYLVLPGKLLGLTTGGILLSSYEEDLTVSDSNSFDIVQVYITPAGSIPAIYTPEFRKLIWQREEYQYPIYYQHVPLATDDETLIVEFTGLQEGTIVHSDQAGFIGVFVDDWQPHTDESNWRQVPNPCPVVEEYQYPIYCKAKANYAELVVCFSDRTTATVIESNMRKYPIGYTSPHWFSHTSTKYWDIIEPPKPTTAITLEDICNMLGVVIKEVQ